MACRGLCVLLAAVLLVLSTTEVKQAYVVYPYFRQCDPKWANHKMGLKNCSVDTCAGAKFGRDTVCSEGCAMSCVSMALNSYGYKVDNKPPDPGSLNQWLVENCGYECLDGNCNNLALKQVEKIDPYRTIIYHGEIFKPNFTFTSLVEMFDEGLVVIAHVRNRTHFVLLDGYRNGTQVFNVMDPFYNTSSYMYTDINDVIVYSMKVQFSATDQL